MKIGKRRTSMKVLRRENGFGMCMRVRMRMCFVMAVAL